MKGWVKKLILIVGAVASLIIIGTSVSGWLGGKDNTKIENTDNETNTEVSVVSDMEV
ncbi:MAG: hypothetical protein IJC07_00395 [Clostridia bacterium]|nr:hypothetical protein [Clostridia bacterium]